MLSVVYIELCSLIGLSYTSNSQDYERSIKGYFDAVLDTVGAPETENMGINLLKKGGHYMTLQV